MLLRGLQNSREPVFHYHINQLSNYHIFTLALPVETPRFLY